VRTFLVPDPVKTYEYRPVSAPQTALPSGADCLAFSTTSPGKGGMNTGIPRMHTFVILLSHPEPIASDVFYFSLFPADPKVPSACLRN